MSKTIQDLFTEAEWELLTQELVPQLNNIASLPVPEDLLTKEAEHEA